MNIQLRYLKKKLPIATMKYSFEFGVWWSDVGSLKPDVRYRKSERHFLIIDYSFQTSDFRLPTSDIWLPVYFFTAIIPAKLYHLKKTSQ